MAKNLTHKILAAHLVEGNLIPGEEIGIKIDHTLLLHRDDPLLPVLREAGERFYLMDDNPTAENIARLIFEFVAARGFPVVEVTLWETGTSSASYRP